MPEGSSIAVEMIWPEAGKTCPLCHTAYRDCHADLPSQHGRLHVALVAAVNGFARRVLERACLGAVDVMEPETKTTPLEFRGTAVGIEERPAG